MKNPHSVKTNIYWRVSKGYYSMLICTNTAVRTSNLV